MDLLEISPFSGLNTRFPEHKIASSKKDGKQYLSQLNNMFSLDGKFTLAPGASRYNATPVTGTCRWLKRIYYQDSGNDYRYSFAIMGNKMYKGDDSLGVLNQVSISSSLDISLEPNFFPIESTLKVGGQVCTFFVDGKYFYKFIPNAAGNWERLPILQDIDGNDIEPIFTEEWLDRQCVLVKGRNVILLSANLNPESFDNATDSVLIEVPPGNGGYPRALIKYRGILYIFHDDYFAPVSGSSPTTFGIKPGDIVESYGCSAPRSVILVNNKIGFLNSKNNEYYLTGGTFDSTDEVPLSYPIQLGELMHPTNSVDTVCIRDSELNALRIAYYPSGGAALGNEEIYSFAEKKWCGQTRDRFISCYSQWNGIGDDGRLTTGRSDIGVIEVNDQSENFDTYQSTISGYLDSSDSPHTMTPVASAFIDTSQYRLGYSSLRLASASSDRVTTPNSADFQLGAGDFTIEMFVRFSTLTAGRYPIFMALWTDSGSQRGWEFFHDVTGQKLSFEYSTDGSTVANNFGKSWNPSVSVWYHVAVVRSGTTLYFFVDRQLIGTSTIGTDTIFASNALVRIGTDTNLDNFDGWIDELRVSNGIARYTTSGSVQTDPYTPDSYTKLLMHFETTLQNATAIHYKWVSGSYMPANPLDVQFEDFYIDARPQGNSTVNIAYYIDSRSGNYANENVNQQGEVINLGLIEIADQSVFLNRFVPFVDRSKGRMIRFQIEGNSLNQLLEFYAIYAAYTVDTKKFSKYISGG